ncbi:MAG: GerMN domain-containing protein [Pseudomonadota bacterium]
MIVLILLLPGVGWAQKEPAFEKSVVDEELFEGFVYFTDAQQVALKSEKVRFPSKLDVHQLGREIINTLLAGPSQPNLESLWPKGVKLNALFIADDGKAYVDLYVTPEMTKEMDTCLELLTVYSLVNSLTLNILKIKMVKILVQGKDATTLAGHLDIEYFYRTNMLIVK